MLHNSMLHFISWRELFNNWDKPPWLQLVLFDCRFWNRFMDLQKGAEFSEPIKDHVILQLESDQLCFHVTTVAFIIQCQLINSTFFTIDFPVTFISQQECWLLTRRDDMALKGFHTLGATDLVVCGAWSWMPVEQVMLGVNRAQWQVP